METKERQKMYENPIMELLSMSGPKLMITFHLCLISAVLLYAQGYLNHVFSVEKCVMIFIAGASFWTLSEYLLHRFVFHINGESKFMKAFHYAMHGYHHNHPNDLNRLFMPPLPALLILSLFFLVFYAVMGSYAWYFLPGFEFGYLLYSITHYLSHYKGSSARFKKISHHHLMHHYKSPEKAFGVSSTLWDRIFRTMP